MKLDNVGQSEWQEMERVMGDSGTEYIILVKRSNPADLMCTCTGWTASRKIPKMCKHLKRYLVKQRIERRLSELDYRGWINFEGIDGRFTGVVNLLMEELQEEGVV